MIMKWPVSSQTGVQKAQQLPVAPELVEFTRAVRNQKVLSPVVNSLSHHVLPSS